MSSNRKKDTIKLSYGAKDRAASLLRSLTRARYFGDHLPAEPELSRRLRIPRSSLTLALHRLAAEGYLRPADNDTWFYPGWVHQNPAGRIVFAINIDLLEGWHGIFQDWLIGFEHVMAEEGYETVLAESFKSVPDKLGILQAHREQGVMGMVLASYVEPEIRQFVVQTSTPAVILGNAVVHQEEIGAVCSDNRAGIEKVIDFLVLENHRKIGFYATGLSFHDGFRERYASYKNHMRELDLEPRTELTFNEPHTELSARKAAEIYISQTDKPTAVMCATDRDAFELTAALKHVGITVPKDVSVSGFDNSHYSGILEPPMTTVDIFGLDMGRVAANYLLNEMQAPQLPVRIQLPTGLVVRQSVKTLAHAPALAGVEKVPATVTPELLSY